ncbi:MAG TPA: ACP S-malonyltransferase [Polyangiales bacterium]|nr:ACP S-malonyltransferase [Polyangiales bacterium]
MGKVAFVFPGQGSQHVGMGRAVAEVEAGRDTFARADRALGDALSRLCFEGPEAELQLTANAQPAILTTSIALFRVLDRSCDVTAGHSLGEYSANVAAGTLEFDAAVALVRKRGQYMQEAVPVGVGAMAAVLGADAETVERICSETAGVVSPVNYNCPGQLVIAGESQAVAAASTALGAAGGKVKALPVSAPFHCALMKPAEERLQVDLQAAAFVAPRVPIYVNVDAVRVDSGDVARDALIRQVSRPVRWQQSVEKMLADGVTLFVEIGPGKVLTNLVKRIAKDVERVNVETPADIEAARNAIAKHR